MTTAPDEIEDTEEFSVTSLIETSLEDAGITEGLNETDASAALELLEETIVGAVQAALQNGKRPKMPKKIDGRRVENTGSACIEGAKALLRAKIARLTNTTLNTTDTNPVTTTDSEAIAGIAGRNGNWRAASKVLRRR